MSEVWIDRYLMPTSILESIQAREPIAWACGCKFDKSRDWMLLCGFHEFMFENLKRKRDA